jgi:O-antigen/teichoic acid export membrane protein
VLRGRSSPVAASRVAAAGLAALLVFVTSAVLSPAARGELAALQSAGILLATLGGGSLALGVSVVVGERAGMARSMAALSALASLALAAVLVLLALTLTPAAGVALTSGLAAVAAAAALAWYGALQGVPIGLGALRAYAGADLARAVVSVAAVGIALALGSRDPAVLLVCWAAGPVAGALGLLGTVPAERTPGAFGGGAREALRRSLRAHPANVVGLAVTRLDIVVLAAVSTKPEVAYYSLAVVIAEAAWLLPSALAVTAQSDYVRLAPDAAGRAAWAAVRRTVLASLASAIAAGALGAVCILAFLPDDYHAALAPLAVLLGGAVPYSVGHVISPYLVTAVDSARRATAIALATLAFDLALVIGVGGPWGAVGAAVASTAAYWLNAALNVAALRATAPRAPSAAG